ncbi:MAG TPA: radical SAM/SPASM domain-containing protein [Bryobacteraceae bacterium]|jgi:MoaA/NifB/PqqE/SkfB family radical SAM enzyme|nr:radical SAM/SPASM domain-containing protein [Bryobacteraceae bacterium]
MLGLTLGRKNGLREAVGAFHEKSRPGAAAGDVLAALDRSRDAIRNALRRTMAEPAATALALKLCNLLLARHHFLARDARLISRPPGLLVDPSNGCNLACPGCVQSTRAKSLKLFDWKNGLLPADRFAALLERYGPYVMQVMFCNYGEPLTNPNTPQLIAQAKSYYAQTALSTNLSVGRFDAEAYVRSGLDFMYLAIDGATQPVYSRYRKNGDIEVIYRNVESLVAAKRRLGSRTPVLRWQYLAFEHNVHEAPLALETARRLGVDQFALEVPFDVSWDDPGVHVARDVHPFHEELIAGTEEILAENWNRPVPKECAELVAREFARGWSGQRDSGEAGASAPSHTCKWLYKSMTLDANGRILPCCGAPKPGVDVVFGGFGSGQVDEFNSEPYRQARRFFLDPAGYEAVRASGGPAVYCANCEWDQERTEFGAREVAQYLRTAGRGAIDAATIQMCSDW